MAAKVVSLSHISRESSDIKRLAKFYQEIFGFEEIESPNFGEFKLPEGPWSATSPVADPKHLPRGHHICLSVSNFESFLQTLKDKGIETFERSVPGRNIKQVFFFDPDGNGLEVASVEEGS
ncbi:Lactoylglutathione lyase/glyoxalase I family protein [Quillaja saponaria]|uniref:Lactoylglutathione lyase/glyoxalase I family protein n=1 Tax=Quillaja saponaria TaxID=32244 RepID=A0AAD7LB44_QUISA|nr:Lactoylglutathione lyase/glyoxalase I family protein [Quillaja saponaria]